ncbi:MAG TPA: UDP-N-acetylglucosamine 2-epimerase (non-hydrolyzing) [Candidatus Omnitrophota bacterium]|nr:UDP-N-acetylglucosamine 2-epimerase (non-hydrolyzing) [Candidatus Omnitrophota bacterium]
MRVLAVFGTRPEAIKLAPVVRELQKTRGIECLVCVTGQHRRMLDQVLELFGIIPDHDLDVMKHDQSVEEIISGVIKGLGKVFDKVKPDIVVVQGDTTTAFAAALSAFLRKIKVAHVEAGLRSYDKFKPYPEEVQRRLLSHLADFHFSPTPAAAENLRKENIDKNSIFITGNTVVDALLGITGRKIKGENQKIDGKFPLDPDAGKKIILVTAHRRESFGRDMENMFKAIKKIAEMRPDVEIIYPVHLNPNVRSQVSRILRKVPRVNLTEPMEYEPFVRLMKMSYLILTDSGGIQEEAPALNKPVLVMRQVTERPEGVRAGCAMLLGTGTEDIVKGVIKLIENKELYMKMSKARNPYGDGKASKRIAEILKNSAKRSGRAEIKTKR